MSKWISPKKYECDRCYRQVPAYYILSHLVKGLYVQCPTCKTHPRSFVDGLDLPQKPSKEYLKMKAGEKTVVDNKQETML